MAVSSTFRKLILKTRIIKRFYSIVVFSLLFFQTVTLVQARTISQKTEKGNSPNASVFSLPSTYGKIIYRYNETSPNKVYIIGINHRDSCTRLNGNKTAKTQTEVYRIGEWLNHNRNLDLLLPEGYFNTKENQISDHPFSLRQPFDDNALEKTLADNSHFINAEMLLMQRFHMRASQVENERLYDAVLNKIVKLETNHNDATADLTLERQIDRLQEERTTAILQNIPKVIETEFQRGAIKNKNALFTIGLNHIATIINSLKDDKGQLPPSQSASSSNGRYSPILDLRDKGYCVIVIIPKTLLRDRKIMQMTNLIGMM